MSGGREMDARIATEVMGWTRRVRKGARPLSATDDWKPPEGDLEIDFYWLWAPPGLSPETHWRALPKYSSDIAAAFQVVERVKELGFEVFEVHNHCPDAPWCALFCSEKINEANLYEGQGDTAPEAICRAALCALRALGKEGKR